MYKSLIVREQEKYIILKDNILLHDNGKIKEYIQRTELNLSDVINELSHVMVKLELSYENVCYCAVVENYEMLKYEIQSREINNITRYNNGVIRLSCGMVNCRYLDIYDIPSLLFVLRLIDRIMMYVD